MRRITKRHSTKSERIVYEVLKELDIPFKHRWIIEGKEVDFLLFDNICLEIDGHEQDGERNHFLASKGFVPIHLSNKEITKETVFNLIKNVYN